jgi:hypothetical protein
MIRFVAVATMRRGALAKPEALDDANQWRAFSAWREEVSRSARVEFELGYDDARIVWNRSALTAEMRQPGRRARRRIDARKRDPRIKRMMELARTRKAGLA